MTLEQAFAKAVNSKANRLDDGTVDWNYVDSDCAMDMELASSYQSKESDNFSMIDCEDFYATHHSRLLETTIYLWG